MYNGVIRAKILHLSEPVSTKRKHRLKLKASSQPLKSDRNSISRTDSGKNVTTKVPSNQRLDGSSATNTGSQSGSKLDRDLNSFEQEEINAGSRTAQEQSREQLVDTDKTLLNFFNNEAADSKDGHYSDAAPQPSRAVDIDIDFGPPSPAVTADIPIPSRDELAAQREMMEEEKVRAALEFKQQLDAKQKAHSEDVEAAKAKHDKSLQAWATNNNEKRNVRTLLSTMHTVLWPGNTWKPVGLGDVIDSKQVKLQYRKAMLVVHPDRCSNQTAEVRFIAKRVFEAINEAYQDFLTKEGLSA
eukprot:gene13-12_t